MKIRESNRHLNDIYASTKSVMFFGTPHFGSNFAAFHATILNICSIFTASNTRLIRTLIPESEILQRIQKQYADISPEFGDVYFYETYPTKLPGGKKVTVSPLQATQIFLFSCALS